MMTRTLVLGVTGMLGHTLYRNLSRQNSQIEVYGTARRRVEAGWFAAGISEGRIHAGVEATDLAYVRRVVRTIQPAVMINCIGIVKQLDEAKDPVVSIRINSLLPHELLKICQEAGTRLIHISTDCVFDGSRGGYTEADKPNACDLYGRSKALGEVMVPGHVTIRTSIIGHELETHHGLVEWFLSQKGAIRGFRRSFFSGLPTVELARVLAQFVLPNERLPELLHISAERIDKHTLLSLVKKQYGHSVHIEKDDGVLVDRSLDSSCFRRLSGYAPPAWPELIETMYSDWKVMACA